MVVHITNHAADVALKAIVALPDAGTAGELIIYSGTRPATADTAVGGGPVALITFVLPNPAFNATTSTISNGQQATANPITAVQAAATGTATWFRVFDGNGTSVFDGTVTDTTGNGDLKLSTVNVVSGIDVSVVSLNAVMPNGT